MNGMLAVLLAKMSCCSPVQAHEDRRKPALERMIHHCDLTHGNIVIVIATPRMAQLAARHGNDGPAFMDATHSMVKYDGYKLVTIIMLDEAEAAVPVAWAITQHETTTVYATVIRCVKRMFEMHANAGQADGVARWEWKPTCFLIDNSDAEMNGVRCAQLCMQVTSRV